MSDKVASPFDSPINLEDLGAELPEKIATEVQIREVPDTVFDPEAANPGPRKLLWGSSFARGKLTVLGGTSGVTKSTYCLTTALAMTVGKDLLGDGPKEDEPLSVAYMSTEDELDDLQRVALAAMQVHDISKDDIGGRLHLTGNDTIEDFALVAPTADGEDINRPEMQFLRDFVDTADLDVLFIDPLFGATGGYELTPELMNIVARALAQLARRKNISVCLVHHTRKTQRTNGQPDAEDLSGGKPLMNAARVVLMASRITAKEADAYQCKSEAHRIIKVVDAKTNLGPHGRCRYYKVDAEVVTDANGSYEVQAVKQWLPPDVGEGVHSVLWSELQTVMSSEFVIYSKTSKDSPQKLEAVLKRIAARLSITHNTDKMSQELRDKKLVVGRKEANPNSDSRTKVQRAVLGDNPEPFEEEVDILDTTVI